MTTRKNDKQICTKVDLRDFLQLKQQLEKMSRKLQEAQGMLLLLEEKYDELTIKYAQLDVANEKDEMLLKQQKEVVKECKSHYDQLLQKVI